MRRATSLWLLSVFLLGTLILTVYVHAQDFRDRVVIMSSLKRRGPARESVENALRRCADELRVANKSMPRIVLLAARKDDAEVADVHDWGHIYVETHPNSGKTVYMAWIVEDATDADLMQIFMTILNDEFQLRMSAEQVKTVSRRLAVESMSKVSVNALLTKVDK